MESSTQLYGFLELLAKFSIPAIGAIYAVLMGYRRQHQQDIEKLSKRIDENEKNAGKEIDRLEIQLRQDLKVQENEFDKKLADQKQKIEDFDRRILSERDRFDDSTRKLTESIRSLELKLAEHYITKTDLNSLESRLSETIKSFFDNNLPRRNTTTTRRSET